MCARIQCLKKARKTRALGRCLEAAIPEEVYDRLEKEMGAQNHG